MNSSKTFIYLLTGVAVGAAAGILLAPHSGAKTREKIMKRTRNLLGDIKGKADDVADRLKDGYNSAKDNLSKAF